MSISCQMMTLLILILTLYSASVEIISFGSALHLTIALPLILICAIQYVSYYSKEYPEYMQYGCIFLTALSMIIMTERHILRYPEVYTLPEM